jgi:hypothetical protein
MPTQTRANTVLRVLHLLSALAVQIERIAPRLVIIWLTGTFVTSPCLRFFGPRCP